MVKLDIRLSSAEIGGLWNTYMQDSLNICSVLQSIDRQSI